MKGKIENGQCLFRSKSCFQYTTGKVTYREFTKDEKTKVVNFTGERYFELKDLPAVFKKMDEFFPGGWEIKDGEIVEPE